MRKSKRIGRELATSLQARCRKSFETHPAVQLKDLAGGMRQIVVEKADEAAARSQVLNGPRVWAARISARRRSVTVLVIGVSRKPGRMAFTRMLDEP